MRTLRAEILAFGDELIRGERINTNSAWLSLQLADLGISSDRHQLIGDDLQESVTALREAATRAQIVVCSGGLGPTADDLTREALAVAFDRPLEHREQEFQRIQAMFASRQRTMPERNRVQAQFPAGSTSILNPHGTAPGIALDLAPSGPLVIALPGVPAEMREMWPTVADLIRQRSGPLGTIRTYCLHCFGQGESHIESLIADFTVRGRNPLVGITASEATISLRVAARSHDPHHCEELLQRDINELRARLGDLVFGAEHEQLQDVVVRKLREAGHSLAVVEVGTSGLLSTWLLQADRDRRVFRGSSLFPSDGALPIHGPLSGATRDSHEAICRDWATYARETFAAAVALCLYRPLGGGTDADDPIWIGCSTATEGLTRRHTPAGHPELIMPRAAKDALNWLRLLPLPL